MSDEQDTNQTENEPKDADELNAESLDQVVGGGGYVNTSDDPTLLKQLHDSNNSNIGKI